MSVRYSTRFNPTTSGELTVGNLYTALVNATEAHRSGGKFILRVDDTQKYWLYKHGKRRINELTANFYDDIKDFVGIDELQLQSVMPKIESIVDIPKGVWKLIRRSMFQHDQLPEWTTSPDMEMYPYAPMYTLERVVWDYYEGVRWLIRGEDLVSEFSLYSHFVDVLGLPRDRHTYIPRLRTQENKELMEISKSLRSYILRDQVEKFGVDGVQEFLAKSCLNNPEGEFVVENIKCQPTIVGFKAS